MKIRKLRVLFAVPLVFGLALPLRAQTLGQNPERALGNTLFQNGTANWELGDAGGMSSMRVVSLAPSDAGGAKRALLFDVQSAVGLNPWDIALRQNVGVAVEKNEALRLSFWARADKVARVSSGVEDGGDYHKIVWNDAVELSPTWKRYEVVGAADRDFAADKLRFVFNMGQQSAQIWLADVRLEDPKNALPAQIQATGPMGTLEKPLSLVADGVFGEGWNHNGLTVETFDSGRVDVGRAARLTMGIVPPNPWEARLGAGNPSPVNGGDVIGVRVWARSATKNKMALVFQQSSAPYAQFLNQTVALTPDWKEYRFIGLADNKHFDAGQSNFEIHAGYGVGTIEVGNVRVEDFGQSSRDEVSQKIGGETVDLWAGRAHDDSWKAAALARIEQNRKADLRIRVVDGEGRAVSGALIGVKMMRHAFRFGTAITSTNFWTSDSPASRRFKEIAAQNFNTITIENGLKWPNDSPGQQTINESILSWAKANNIEVRGHNLVWGSFALLPHEIDGKKAAEMSNDELKSAIEKHVRDYVRRFKGRVYVWDVVNEAVAEHEVWDKLGWDEFARVFQIAREEDPNVLLAYNDYKLFHLENDSEWQKERAVIQKLIDAKVPLDVLGEQAHMGVPLLPLPTVLANLGELGQYGKSIEITEFDLGARDDAAHAAYVRDFMMACFSDPNVVSFVQWGFWEGAHWRAKEGGHLVRRDFSFRPAMDAYRDLVFKQWWTNASGQSDHAGAFATRGFKGDYELRASKNGKTAVQMMRLDEKTGNITLVLK